MRVEELFKAGAFGAIESAVREAEQRTSGEIVPMLVDQSDGYNGVRAAVAALLAFAVGVVLVSLDLEPALSLPPSQIAALAVGYWLAGRRSLLRLLIPSGIRAAAVGRAARLAFLEEGLIETRDRTGILIYVSLLEHRVEVLADRGIDREVEDGSWDGVVATILAGIRERRAEQGLIDAIGQCGDLLASNFPPRPDDTDELANRVRGDVDGR